MDVRTKMLNPELWGPIITKPLAMKKHSLLQEKTSSFFLEERTLQVFFLFKQIIRYIHKNQIPPSENEFKNKFKLFNNNSFNFDTFKEVIENELAFCIRKEIDFKGQKFFFPILPENARVEFVKNIDYKSDTKIITRREDFVNVQKILENLRGQYFCGRHGVVQILLSSSKFKQFTEGKLRVFIQQLIFLRAISFKSSESSFKKLQYFHHTYKFYFLDSNQEKGLMPSIVFIQNLKKQTWKAKAEIVCDLKIPKHIFKNFFSDTRIFLHENIIRLFQIKAKQCKSICQNEIFVLFYKIFPLIQFKFCMDELSSRRVTNAQGLIKRT